MKLKSYFAGTVEAAMTLASRELGDEAMLMYSREASPEARHLGRHEVVFAAQEPAARPVLEPMVCIEPSRMGTPQTPQTPPRREASDATPIAQFQAEMQAMRAQLEKLAAQVASHRPTDSPGVRMFAPVPRFDSARSNFRTRIEVSLAAAEMPRDLVDRVVARWSESADESVETEYLPLLRRILGEMVSIDSKLGDSKLSADEDQCRVIAIVGAPGVGKTTALVKLAARYGLMGRRPAQLIGFDNCRIGGAEQLRTYAAILGIGFQSVDTAGALRQALEEHRHKEMVLIDTAGMSASQEEEGEELSRFLMSRPEVDVHLALSASMKPADLKRVVDRFVRFRPNKLLFTRLDETSTFGPLWAEAVTQSKPLSFFCDGPRIPEDLQEATAERAAALVLGTAFTDWETDTSFDAAGDTGTPLNGLGYPQRSFSPAPSSNVAAAA